MAIPGSPEATEGIFDYQILRNHLQREVIKSTAITMTEQASYADTLVFLDKTARPLSELVRDLWPAINGTRKLVPIRFLNLGSEKVSILRNFAQESSHLAPQEAIDSYIGLIKDKHSLEEVYGKENAKELFDMLKSCKGKNRLVIDEATDSGNTQKVAAARFCSADPENKYPFLTLHDPDLDRQPFMASYSPMTPWHSTLALVDDLRRERASFRVDRLENVEYYQKGRQLRKEFDALASEITSTMRTS